jgi:hypothetical protein
VNTLIFEEVLKEILWLLNEELFGKHGVLNVAVLFEEIADDCFLVL